MKKTFAFLNAYYHYCKLFNFSNKHINLKIMYTIFFGNNFKDEKFLIGKLYLKRLLMFQSIMNFALHKTCHKLHY